MQTYTPPMLIPKPDDYDAFMASLSAEERELHIIAESFLGSSYFVQWTHGYIAWTAANAKGLSKK
jgi:hypothetical protein